MGVILVPKRGEHVSVNWWNWRASLAILDRAALVDDEQFERMGSNGCGGQADDLQAQRFAEYLNEFLREMGPDTRVRYDGTATTAPKSQGLDGDSNDLYSATYEWLVKFRDFCAVCGGFEVM